MVVSEETQKRFWSKVDKKDTESCWLWLGHTDSHGYGRLRKEGVNTHWTASRLSLIIQTNRLPESRLEMACHTCDNPRCVNPHHLYWGNNSTNQKDAVERGRKTMPEAQGEKNGYSKLTEQDVKQIRNLIKEGLYNTTIGEMFGVHHSTVSLIRLNKAWQFVR